MKTSACVGTCTRVCGLCSCYLSADLSADGSLLRPWNLVKSKETSLSRELHTAEERKMDSCTPLYVNLRTCTAICVYVYMYVWFDKDTYQPTASTCVRVPSFQPFKMDFHVAGDLQGGRERARRTEKKKTRETRETACVGVLTALFLCLSDKRSPDRLTGCLVPVTSRESLPRPKILFCPGGRCGGQIGLKVL